MGRTYRKRKHRFKSRDCLNVGADMAIVNLNKHLKQIGWQNDTKLMVGCFAQTGRGIYSKTSTVSSDLLIKMPCDQLITLATLEKDENFSKILTLKEEADKISIQAMLSLYLLFLQHKNQKIEYLETLPKTFTNPIYCKKSELMVLPQSLFVEILAQDNAVKSSYEAITKLLGDIHCDCCQHLFIPDVFSMQSFKWAYFAVNTRTVYFEPNACGLLCDTHNLWDKINDEPNAALAPFLDLFNHSDSVVCTSTLSKTLQEISGEPMKHLTLTYQLMVDKNYTKYEQIFVNYGPLSNTKLILDYGFFIRNNKHDRISISMSDIHGLVAESKQQNIHRNKFKFIEMNAINQEMFIDRQDGFSHQLLVVLTLIFVTQEHFDNILNKIAFSDTPDLMAVHKWTSKLITMKRTYFDCSRNLFKNLAIKEKLSDSGEMVYGYIEECIQLLDDVTSKFFSS